MKQSKQQVLTKQDPSSDHAFDQYISFLESHGLKYNEALYPAFFTLKNGLIYSGMRTSRHISKNQIIVHVPISMLLTTHKALEQQSLRQLYKQKFFYQIFDIKYAQGKILVVYLLYLLENASNSLWATMAKNFPKNIDILSFWDQQEINRFKDPTIQTAASLQRQNFERQWSLFRQLQKQHKIVANESIFNYQNYKWLYIHTVSRCFGSYLNSTYFVPFCQLLNHNCVDVSYRCVEQAIQGQQSNENGQNNQYNMISKTEKIIVRQQQDDCDSFSSSSANSEQYIEQNDFDYLSIDTYQIKWCSKQCLNLKQKQVKIIKEQVQKIERYIDEVLEWKRGSTLTYICQITEKLKIIHSQFTAGRKKFPTALDDLQRLFSQINIFHKESTEFFRKNNQSYQKKPLNRNRQDKVKEVQIINVKDTYEKSLKPPTNKYKEFVMETRDGTEFKKGEQVYFSYGKHSNRTLLIRYGFCLQQNRYEHVWIKVQLAKYLSAYPDTTQKVLQKELPIVYKIKLKQSRVCSQLILWFKSLKWRLTHDRFQDLFFISNIDRQIQALKQSKQLCEKNLEIYGSQNQTLQDQSIGYHQYFTRVYHNGKRRIILGQISLFQQCIIFLLKIQKRLDEGQKLSQIKQKINLRQANRKIRCYLKGISGLIK